MYYASKCVGCVGGLIDFIFNINLKDLTAKKTKRFRFGIENLTMIKHEIKPSFEKSKTY